MSHLDKSELALANITAGVSYGQLSVVLYPALSTQDVVDTRCHLVPLIAVSHSIGIYIKHVSLQSYPIIQR